jgi:hypothetical protein
VSLSDFGAGFRCGAMERGAKRRQDYSLAEPSSMRAVSRALTVLESTAPSVLGPLCGRFLGPGSPGYNRGRDKVALPLPPNRTGGFPASGSPVGG